MNETGIPVSLQIYVAHKIHIFKIVASISHSHCVSPRTPSGKHPIYFLNNPLEEVASLKLLCLTSFHDLSWESHIFKLASEASLGILCHAKSFLGTPELFATYTAFIHSLMESYSLLRAAAPASHLSRLHAVETKAFRISGISHDEAEYLSLSLTGGWLVVFPSSTDSSPGLASHPSLFYLCYVPLIFMQGV